MQPRLILLLITALLFLVSAAPAEDEETSITDWLIHLIVPSDEFFQNRFDELDERLRDKLPFQTYINTLGRLKYVSNALDGNSSVLDFEFDYMGTPINIELGRFIDPFLPRVRSIITGLYILFIAVYNYRQIMFLIRGTIDFFGNRTIA